MPKPACPKCLCFFKPKKNGFAWIEGMPLDGAQRGLREPENWCPYKLWQSDLWECPDCQAQIIVGHGANPVSEHYKDNFKEQISAFGATLQINDC